MTVFRAAEAVCEPCRCCEQCSPVPCYGALRESECDRRCVCDELRAELAALEEEEAS